MATQHFFRKTLTGLAPTTEAGKEWLNSLKLGEVLRGEFKRPRNIHHHDKFFAMLTLIYQNQTHYKSVDDILLVFKHRIGHGHWILTRHPDKPDVTIEIFQPHSISFAKMDQAEFDIFYRKALDFVTSVVIPGLDSGDLERELMEFAT